MVLDAVSNFVRGRVSSAVATSDTTVSVEDASIFPDPETDGEYNVVIWDANNFPRPDQDSDVEIVRVTARDTGGDELTVVRGQETTSDVAHPEGSAVHLSPTAKMFSDIEAEYTAQGENFDGQGTSEFEDLQSLSTASAGITERGRHADYVFRRAEDGETIFVSNPDGDTFAEGTNFSDLLEQVVQQPRPEHKSHLHVHLESDNGFTYDRQVDVPAGLHLSGNFRNGTTIRDESGADFLRLGTDGDQAIYEFHNIKWSVDGGTILEIDGGFEIITSHCEFKGADKAIHFTDGSPTVIYTQFDNTWFLGAPVVFSDSVRETTFDSCIFEQRDADASVIVEEGADARNINVSGGISRGGRCFQLWEGLNCEITGMNFRGIDEPAIDLLNGTETQRDLMVSDCHFNSTGVATGEEADYHIRIDSFWDSCSFEHNSHSGDVNEAYLGPTIKDNNNVVRHGRRSLITEFGRRDEVSDGDAVSHNLRGLPDNSPDVINVTSEEPGVVASYENAGEDTVTIRLHNLDDGTTFDGDAIVSYRFMAYDRPD